MAEKIDIDLKKIPGILSTIHWYIELKIFEDNLLPKIRNNIKITNNNISTIFIDDVKKIVKEIYGSKRMFPNNIYVSILNFNDIKNKEIVQRLENCIKVFFYDLFSLKNFDNIMLNISS